MRYFANGLARLTFRIMAGLCVVAIFLGRHAAEPRTDRVVHPRFRATPRYRSYGGTYFRDLRHSPRLLDVETGEVVRLPVSDDETFDFAVCSPWRDDRGQYHLVGLWLGRFSADPNSLVRAFGLARFTFPEGRILDRVALDPMPLGTPCWHPDGSGRVLYVSGDGRLYHFGFPLG